jgi:hypothetical protein
MFLYTCGSNVKRKKFSAKQNCYFYNIVNKITVKAGHLARKPVDVLTIRRLMVSCSPNKQRVTRDQWVPNDQQVTRDQRIPNDQRVTRDQRIPNNQQVRLDQWVPNDQRVLVDQRVPIDRWGQMDQWVPSDQRVPVDRWVPIGQGVLVDRVHRTISVSPRISLSRMACQCGTIYQPGMIHPQAF